MQLYYYMQKLQTAGMGNPKERKECPICAKTLYDRSTWNRHMRIHTGTFYLIIDCLKKDHNIYVSDNDETEKRFIFNTLLCHILNTNLYNIVRYKIIIVNRIKNS